MRTEVIYYKKNEINISQKHLMLYDNNNIITGYNYKN